MKITNKIISLSLAATALLSATSCIDEIMPANGTVIEDQIKSAGLESSINGISAQMTQGYLVYGDNSHETDMSYPMFMIAGTEMLGDMYPGGESGYDWYRAYNCMNEPIGATSYFSYLPWRTLYMYIKSANDIIRTYKSISSPSVNDKNNVAKAYAYRAFSYYMLTVCYEPKANIYTDCSDVLGLTVPIVTEETTEKQSNNNPRASHEDMMSFILADLQKAYDTFTETGYSSTQRYTPSLATVCGLMARAYLWDEQYDKAFDAADEAITLAQQSGCDMMSKNELTNANTAFAAAASSWMWYGSYAAENLQNLANIPSHISNEASWGYSTLSKPVIDKSLYDKMGKADYRRKWFLDPQRKKGDYETVRDEEYLADLPDYASLKFRCASGNYKDYTEGATTDVPFMRLEELYLLRAEAAGMSKSVAEGVSLLNNWVKTYRDVTYNCTATTERDLQLAVLDQMRIEFWGEGVAFFSAKRIQPGVMQYYAGSNAPSVIYHINAEGMKPNWNYVIPNSEVQSNKAIANKNNPDPTLSIDYYKVQAGVYAPGNVTTTEN